MSTANAEPESPEAPWTMPAKFLPVPKGFSCQGNSRRMDLHGKSHNQLLALASSHNSRQGIIEDPFVTALQGIPERAKLRPDSKVAITHTMGGVPNDSPYAKAWRSIKRKHVKSGSGKRQAAGDDAAKRTDTAGTAARTGKLQSRPAHEQQSTRTPARQQLLVPPEQMRWRSKLEAFLGRAVVVPQLGPEAPVLDLNKLFLEVMNQGGMKDVTASNSWPALALQLQRDADLADQVQAVYNNYLQPLEKDLPYGFRPARNIDHLDSRIQQRASMAGRMASYDAVTFAWQSAAAALTCVMPWASEPAVQLQHSACNSHVSEQGPPRDHQLTVSEVTGGVSSRQRSHLTNHAVVLLRNAAVQPIGVIQQLQCHNIAPGLHGPSKDACISQIRRALASRRKGKAVGVQGYSDWYADNEEAVLSKFQEDAAADQATAVAAAAADKASEAKGTASTVEALQQQQQLLQDKVAAGGDATEAGDEASLLPKRARQDEQDIFDQPAQFAAVEMLGSEQEPPQQLLLPSGQVTSAAEPAQRLQLNAVQWLLLSRRAVLSGPPGCDKPLLQLSGQGKGVSNASSVAAGANSSSKAARLSWDGKQTTSTAGSGGDGQSKRTHLGITPKCGVCRTCLNPSLKKACIVNRERIAEGLPPLTK